MDFYEEDMEDLRFRIIFLEEKIPDSNIVRNLFFCFVTKLFQTYTINMNQVLLLKAI